MGDGVNGLIVEYSSYTAPARTNNQPKHKRLAWQKLARAFAQHERSSDKDGAGWSPAVYGEGKTRANHNVQFISMAVGDFDHCTEIHLNAIKDRLNELDLEYVLYSTYNSAPPEDYRFRVVIPFSQPVGPNDWPETWHRVNHHVFCGLNDPATKDHSRFFYVPAAPPDALVFTSSHTGSALDPTTLPPGPVGAQDAPGEHEPIDEDLIFQGIPEGQRDSLLFRYACKMRSGNVPIAMALLAIAEAARRCNPPFDIPLAESKVLRVYKLYQPKPVLTLNGHVGTPSTLEVTSTPFPVDALPDALRRYTEHVARLKVCPPEYVAVPLLVAAGAMLGNVVQIALNSSWSERAQIFAAIVGPPGAKKSPAITSALAPVRGIQQKLGDAYAKELKQYRAEKQRYESIPKKDRENHDPPVAPTYGHVMTNDVTIEKLAEMLSKSKGILLSHDELAAWVLSMDQYRSGKGADRQHFLSMWTGTSFKVDRKANPEPIYVKHPCLGIIGGIQPEMLTDLVDKHGRSDGFLDRILWAYPDPIPGKWVESDEQDTSGVADVFQKLYDCYGSTDLIGNHVTLTLRFSDEAMEIWKDWYNETEDDINLHTIERILEGSWAKMPSQCARLAVILHMIDGENTNSISVATLRNAIRITEYFKDQCRNVFASLADAIGKDDGLRVLEYVRAQGEATQTAIANDVFMKHKSAKELNSLLSDLEARGLVRHREEATGGRKRVIWRLLWNEGT